MKTTLSLHGVLVAWRDANRTVSCLVLRRGPENAQSFHSPSTVRSVCFDKEKPSKLKQWPDSRAGISRTERNLEFEQAQSYRWLKQHAHGNQSIADATQIELQALFRCRTIEQIEARPELTVESKAILEVLEAERERSRIVQGGVANPNDWFLTPNEENILASLMGKATLDETGDAKPKEPERSKVAKSKAPERSKIEQAIADFEEQEARDKSEKAKRRLVQDQLPRLEVQGSNKIATD